MWNYNIIESCIFFFSIKSLLKIIPNGNFHSSVKWPFNQIKNYARFSKYCTFLPFISVRKSIDFLFCFDPNNSTDWSTLNPLTTELLVSNYFQCESLNAQRLNGSIGRLWFLTKPYFSFKCVSCHLYERLSLRWLIILYDYYSQHFIRVLKSHKLIRMTPAHRVSDHYHLIPKIVLLSMVWFMSVNRFGFYILTIGSYESVNVWDQAKIRSQTETSYQQFIYIHNKLLEFSPIEQFFAIFNIDWLSMISMNKFLIIFRPIDLILPDNYLWKHVKSCKIAWIWFEFGHPVSRT